MTTDPLQLRPDHLPTPFSADEIRIGCPPGRTVRSLVREAEGDPYLGMTRFVTGDAEGADQEFWRETPDGIRLTEPQRRRSTWLEFQGHASMSSATTEITEEDIEIPAGHFAYVRYTRTEGDSVSAFWFAMAAPGLPMKFEMREAGRLVYSSIVLEDVTV
ncbi:MAG: hypothetical protein ABI573_10270 [Chloroflexota bacterium]